MTAVHTIAIPRGWSAEQTWEAISRGDHLEGPFVKWQNIVVRDGKLVKVIR